MKKKFLEQSSKYMPYVLLAGLALLFVITRFWRITTLPSGVHIDEAGMAYDAWCLSQYGVDRYFKSYPLLLTNFGGGGQSALCIYTTALLFRLFGFHSFLFRVTNIFYSLLTVVFGMLILRKLYPDRPYLAIAGGYLMTILPFFILSARLGMDCHPILGTSTVFIYCFLCALQSEKYRYYVLAGITGGIVLYTYSLSYLILPSFLVLSFFYSLVVKKFSFKKWTVMGIPMGLLASPLIAIQLINLWDLPEMQLGPFTLTKLPGYRVGELGSFQFSNLKSAIATLFTSDIWAYNSIPKFSNLYWISMPLVIIGFFHCIYLLVVSVRKREMDLKLFLLLWALSILYVMSHIYTCLTQLNVSFFVMAVFIVDAVSLIFPLPKKWLDFAGKGALLLVYTVFFLCFSNYYYMGRYTQETYPIRLFFNLQTEAIAFIDEHPEYGEKGVQTAIPSVVYALSCLKSPYELGITLDNTFIENGYIHCSYLGPIEDGYYYIVDDTFPDYITELREKGFTEIAYGHYYLFYKEQ